MKRILLALLLPATLGAQTIDDHFRIDQFGYRPADTKIALIVEPQTGYDAPSPYTPGATLEVHRASDGLLVYSGTPTAWNGGATNAQSGDKVWWFDFSALTTPDNYYIVDPANNTRSYGFMIYQWVYYDALGTAIRTYYYQRCGTPKQDGGNYDDTTACHAGNLQDTDCRDVLNPSNTSTARDLSGGWHDAGDYNKYVNFTHATLHYLLDAYEQHPSVFADTYGIPESGNGIADILDEIKWELDWLLKMQNADGSVLMKVSTQGFQNASPPSTDVAQRLYGETASSATRTFCSVMAHAAKVYGSTSNPALQNYAAYLLGKAQLAWTWLQNNPGYSNYTNTGFGSANPEISQYDQDATSFTAAVYLYAATGNATYRTYVDANYNSIHPMQWTYWYPFESVYQDALLYYTNLPGATAATVTAIRNNCSTSVTTNNTDLLTAVQNQTDPFRAYMKDQDYVWGNNQFKCETGSIFYNMVQYGINTANAATYSNAAEDYLHYIHGVNAVNYAFLTGGYGIDRPVQQIYHGWFGDGTAYDVGATPYIGPPPGYVPGGVNANYQPDAQYSGPPIQPPMNQPVQKCFKDWNTSWPENSWELTEVAIYTEAAYIKLLSKFTDSSSFTTSIPQQATETVSLQLVPNPGNGIYHLSEAGAPGLYAEIYDGCGRQLRNLFVSEATIDLSGLSSGLYFYRLVREGKLLGSGKLVHQRL